MSTHQPPAEPDLERRIRALLDKRLKIAAVKLYREETGSSLLEAKNAVEAVEAGSTLPDREPPADGDCKAEILRLLGDGKKIAAIKLYRQQTGVGLKEAKEAVEELGRRNGIESRGGCLAAVLLVLFFAFAAIGIAGSWASADELTEMSAAKTDDNGILIHEVQSELQAGKTLVRVFLPDQLDEGRRYRVIYVLPVEAGVENRYGDGNFRADHQQAHALLEELQIPHEYRDGPQRKHTWHSGWVEEAVGLLLEDRLSRKASAALTPYESIAANSRWRISLIRASSAIFLPVCWSVT